MSRMDDLAAWMREVETLLSVNDDIAGRALHLIEGTSAEVVFREANAHHLARRQQKTGQR